MAKQGKERIINAAFQLFLEKGYKGVSLKDIITATQLSKGAIYHHFESKYAIYLAAVEEHFFKILTENLPTGDNLNIRHKIRQWFEYFVSQIDAVEKSGVAGIPFPIRKFFIFQLESEQDAFILERVEEAMDYYRQEMTKLIQVAIDKEEIDSQLSADVLGQQIMYMIEGIMVHHSSVEKDCKAYLMTKYDEVIDRYLDLLVTNKSSSSTTNLITT